MHRNLPLSKLKILYLLSFSLLINVNFSFAQTAGEGSESAVPAIEEPVDKGADGKETEDVAGEKPLEEIAPPPLTEEEKAALKEKQDTDRMLELEIKTSTLFELAEWCRELKLSEGGNKEELMQRLRNHFNIIASQEVDGDDQRVITIEKAHSTEYFTITAVDEEYARLSGGVELSLIDGNSIHKIKAWEILFNRTRNIITATGNVEYLKEEDATSETFKGESITINLDTWAGSFIDTISERGISGGDTAYRFAGQVISKTDKETTVLKKARVTNASSDEPYWSLDASRLWILPGSDWGLLSGVLKVGEIPVLWIPAFFLPADEVVFHPVIGTKLREGSFLQTTTYIIGRSSSSGSSENSISKIIGSGSGMEQKREGVFLRTTGRKEQSNDGSKMALLFDIYTNLGIYLGTEIAMPAKGAFSSWTLSGGLAFTRNVYQHDDFSYYSPYAVEEFDSLTGEPTGNNSDEWNESYIFGMNLPFRYRLKTGFSASGKLGSLSLDLPLYSDPFIDWDTMRRTESMDLLEMALKGSTPTTDETPTTQGAYRWTLTANPNISTQIFAPVISSMSISSISSVYSFNYKSKKEYNPDTETYETNGVNQYSPSRIFYYPDKWTMISLSGSLGGTPFSLSSATSVGEKDKVIDDPLKNFGIPRAPWEAVETEKNKKSNNPANLFGDGEYSLEPPSLIGQTFTLGRSNGLRLTWGYSFSPSMSTELYYSSNDWYTQTDIDLNDIKSISLTTRTDGSTTLTLSEPNNNLFSLSTGLTGSIQWQDHIYQNEAAEEYREALTLKDTEKLSDYRSSIWSTSWTAGTQLNPLYWSPSWKTTNLQYNVSGLFVKSKFNDDILEGETAEERTARLLSDPKWDVVWGEWTKEDLGTHRISTNIGVSILEKMQNISLSTDLPPKDPTLSASATARIWKTETSANTSIKNPFVDEREFQAVNFTESIIFSPKINLKQYFTYSPDYEEITNSTTSFVWGNFNMSFNAARSPGYELAHNTDGSISGWKSRDSLEATLRPLSMKAAYSLNFKKTDLWDKRLSYSVSSSSSLNLDLQRYTYSKLSFNLTGTLNISKFLDFSIGTTSENDQMFFYLSGLPLFDDNSTEIKDKVPVYEDNFFLDLLNSFRFDDESIRRKSGFKLKRFNFSLVHHLGDWNATLNVSMSPWRDTTINTSTYKFISNVSFIVQWLPISELKTELSYDGTANNGEGMFIAK